MKTDTTKRAQPGDVLGIEHEGKRTHLGDDKDEAERLENAREAVDDEAPEPKGTPSRDDAAPRVTK